MSPGPARAAVVPPLRRGRRAEQLTTGIGASPGAPSAGPPDSATAVDLGRARRGRDPGPPGDQPGRLARHDRGARLLTAVAARPRTRRSSPAAWVAPACAAPSSSSIDVARGEFPVRDGVTLREGDVISIDGTTGEVLPRRRTGHRLAGAPPPRGRRGDGRAASWWTRWRFVMAPRTTCAAWRCGPTPTPRRTPRAPGASAPTASACAGPSTCSLASDVSWSST